MSGMVTMRSAEIERTRRRPGGIGVLIAAAVLFLSCGVARAQVPGEAFEEEHLAVRAWITPPENGPPHLVIEAKVREGWHTYSVTQSKPPLPTVITVKGNPALKKLPQSKEFLTSTPPKPHFDDVFEKEVEEHEGTIIWFAPLELVEGTALESLQLEGEVSAQVCKLACLQKDVRFTAQLDSSKKTPQAAGRIASPPKTNGAATSSQSSPPATSAAPPAAGGHLPWEPFSLEYFAKLTKFKELADDTSSAKVEAGLDAVALLYYIVIGFVAGLILNVMPCVLPVIGLKIMSFVNQAGSSRARAMALNLWYSAGMMAVFLVLATLAVMFQLAWGGLFASSAFIMGLICIVFVFALSLLGVWEIPVPGFVGGGKVNELAAREGAVGAISKGVLTTILATPCTGPFLTPALSWAISQPPLITYCVFSAVGLGMASPYLLIGAFPRLISFLPKPGAWMDTFKQLMGFVLLATVVWLMYSAVHYADAIPLVAVLFGLWGICWWIGRIPLGADLHVKIQRWAVAGILTAGVLWIGFGWLAEENKEAFEKKYALRVIPQRKPGDYTLLVDFTADW